MKFNPERRFCGTKYGIVTVDCRPYDKKQLFFFPEQHGFISGKSCTTQLLECLEDLTEALDNGKDVDVVYIDFCKAFDKVPHRRRLKKLFSMGLWNQRSNTFMDKRISFK